MKPWRRLAAMLVVLAALAGPTSASAQSLSYGLGFTDNGAPTGIVFSFLIPIAPTTGLYNYSVSLAATLTDGGDGVISVSPSPPGSPIFTFGVNSFAVEVFADALGTITSSFGPLTFTGIVDCGVIVCTSLYATVSFLGTGSGDVYGIAGSITLSEVVSRVPEPGSLALLALGLAGLAVVRRRREGRRVSDERQP